MKEKLKAFFIDDKRKYKDKLLISFLSSFSMIFIYLFATPFLIILENKSEFMFSVTEGMKGITILAVVLVIVLTLFVSVFRGKFYNLLICSILVAAFLGLLEGTFLSNNGISYTGYDIYWRDYIVRVIIDVAIVFLLCFITFLIVYLFGFKKKYIVSVSLILVFLQLVGLVSVGISSISSKDDDKYVLTAKDIDNYYEKNCLVFVIDELDYKFFKNMYVSNPDFFSDLEGFTCYTNATSRYNYTCPAVNYSLTGYSDGAFIIPNKEYIKNAWNSTDILDNINNKCGNIDFYATSTTYFTDNELEKYIGNYSDKNCKLKQKQVIKSLTNLSFTRTLPFLLKPFFYETEGMSDDIYAENKVLGSSLAVDKSFTESSNKEISVSQGEGLKWFHFSGKHSPCCLKTDGSISKNSTLSQDNVYGTFENIYKVIRQLKEKNIYDNSTIIIMADHGDRTSDDTNPEIANQPLQDAVNITLLYKPENQKGEMTFSDLPVSHDNIPATLCKSLGIESYDSYGIPLDEVEDKEIIRKYTYLARNCSWSDCTSYDYEIYGNSNDFSNWKMIDSNDSSNWASD